MGNRQSISSIEFVNNTECAKVEIVCGEQFKVLSTKGASARFEILEASPTVVKGYDKSGRLIHEVKFTIGHVAAAQVWKITSSGVKHKRSPFFTETYTWAQK